MAFSSAKGLDLEWCKNPDRGLLQPDLVLFLDLPIEEAQKRGGFGDERYETLELQTRVRAKFLELREHSWKVRKKSCFRIRIVYLFFMFLMIIIIIDDSSFAIDGCCS